MAQNHYEAKRLLSNIIGEELLDKYNGIQGYMSIRFNAKIGDRWYVACTVDKHNDNIVVEQPAYWETRLEKMEFTTLQFKVSLSDPQIKEKIQKRVITIYAFINKVNHYYKNGGDLKYAW